LPSVRFGLNCSLHWPGALKESAEKIDDLTVVASASDQTDECSEEEEESESDEGEDNEKTQIVNGSVSNLSIPEKQINQLFGQKPPHNYGKEFSRTSVMHFPESFVLKETDSQVTAPTAAEIVGATKKATDHPDVQTSFLSGFHRKILT
jgi:hypothetical protein